MRPAASATPVSTAEGREDDRVRSLQLEQQRLRELAQADRGAEADRAADERHGADLAHDHAAHARGAAPSAIRKPISLVRCVTV